MRSRPSRPVALVAHGRVQWCDSCALSFSGSHGFVETPPVMTTDPGPGPASCVFPRYQPMARQTRSTVTAPGAPTLDVSGVEQMFSDGAPTLRDHRIERGPGRF